MFCGFALLLEIRRVLGPEFLLVHEPAVQVLPDHGLGPVFVPVPDGFQDQCMIRKGCSYAEIMSLRPPMGFEEAYIKKVNYIFSKGIR